MYTSADDEIIVVCNVWIIGFIDGSACAQREAQQRQESHSVVEPLIQHRACDDRWWRDRTL